MDEKIHLKIIANPFRLNKGSKKMKNHNDTDNLLYEYLEKKYKGIYIHHKIYYEIIDSIDSILIEYISKNVINDIINSICNKFDSKCL